MTSALEGGEGSASRPGRTLPLGKTKYGVNRLKRNPFSKGKLSAPRIFTAGTVTAQNGTCLQQEEIAVHGGSVIGKFHCTIPDLSPHAWVCSRLLATIEGSNPARAMNVSLVSRQVEVSASDLSFAQRTPTECGVSEYDSEAPIMKRTWPTRGCCAT